METRQQQIVEQEIADPRLSELTETYGEVKAKTFLLLEEKGYLKLVKHEGSQSLDTSKPPKFIPSLDSKKLISIKQQEVEEICAQIEQKTRKEISNKLKIPSINTTDEPSSSQYTARELFFFSFYDEAKKAITPGMIQGSEDLGIKPLISVPISQADSSNFSDGHIDIRSIQMNNHSSPFILPTLSGGLEGRVERGLTRSPEENPLSLKTIRSYDSVTLIDEVVKRVDRGEGFSLDEIKALVCATHQHLTLKDDSSLDILPWPKGTATPSKPIVGDIKVKWDDTLSERSSTFGVVGVDLNVDSEYSYLWVVIDHIFSQLSSPEKYELGCYILDNIHIFDQFLGIDEYEYGELYFDLIPPIAQLPPELQNKFLQKEVDFIFSNIRRGGLITPYASKEPVVQEDPSGYIYKSTYAKLREIFFQDSNRQKLLEQCENLAEQNPWKSYIVSYLLKNERLPADIDIALGFERARKILAKYDDDIEKGIGQKRLINYLAERIDLNLSPTTPYEDFDTNSFLERFKDQVIEEGSFVADLDKTIRSWLSKQNINPSLQGNEFDEGDYEHLIRNLKDYLIVVKGQTYIRDSRDSVEKELRKALALPTEYPVYRNLNDLYAAIDFSKYSISENTEEIRSQWLEHFLNEHSQYIKNNSKVLDLGSGTGWFMHMLQSSGFNVFGVDISPDQLKSASTNKEYNSGGEKISGKLVNADWAHLPYKEKSMNILFSLGRNLPHTEHALNLMDVFLEANRVLEKDGLFVFDMPDPTTGKYKQAVNKLKKQVQELYGYTDEQMKEFWTLVDGPDDINSYNRYVPDQNQIDKLMQMAGFERVSLQTENVPYNDEIIDKLPDGDRTKQVIYVYKKIQDINSQPINLN